MKLRQFILLAAVFFVACPVLRAAAAPHLDQLLSEYHQARSDVLVKLNASYAAQAEALATQYKQARDPVRAKRAADFAAHLKSSIETNDLDGATRGDPGAGPLAILQADYARSRAENLRNVDTFYITTAQNLQRELLRKNDTAGASVLATFLEKIKPAAAPTHRSSSRQSTPATGKDQ